MDKRLKEHIELEGAAKEMEARLKRSQDSLEENLLLLSSLKEELGPLSEQVSELRSERIHLSSSLESNRAELAFIKSNLNQEYKRRELEEQRLKNLLAVTGQAQSSLETAKMKMRQEMDERMRLIGEAEAKFKEKLDSHTVRQNELDGLIKEAQIDRKRADEHEASASKLLIEAGNSRTKADSILAEARKVREEAEAKLADYQTLLASISSKEKALSEREASLEAKKLEYASIKSELENNERDLLAAKIRIEKAALKLRREIEISSIDPKQKEKLIREI